MLFKLSPLSFSHFPKIISSSLKILAKFEDATGEWRYIYREQWPHSLVSWVRACAAALLTTTSANSCDQHMHCAPPVAYLYSATVEAVCVPHKNEVSTWLGFGVFEVLSRSLASLCECCATRQQTVKRQPTMGHSTPGSMQTCMVAHQWCALLCASFSLPTSHCFASFSSLHANFLFPSFFFFYLPKKTKKKTGRASIADMQSFGRMFSTQPSVSSQMTSRSQIASCDSVVVKVSSSYSST